jgi:hypothetical protein
MEFRKPDSVVLTVNLGIEAYIDVTTFDATEGIDGWQTDRLLASRLRYRRRLAPLRITLCVGSFGLTGKTARIVFHVRALALNWL